MSLELDPAHVLQFEKPLDRVVKQVIVLKNPSNQVVAFKVKTTAPKVYCVRPNVGRLEPFASETVSVFLQPQKHEPTESTDKFLILSTPLADPNVRTTDELHAMWAHVESKEKNRMTHAKLLCEFVDSPFPAVPKQDQPIIEPEEQIPQVAEKDQTIHQLNQTIQDLKRQLVGYKEQVVDLRQRKPPSPIIKYVPEIKYVSRPQRVVAQTTYPGSAVVAVALVAFLLGYLVIRAT